MPPDMSELDKLMRAALAGDDRAYKAFLLQAAGLLRAYARSRLARAGRAADAEDVVQETLMAVHMKRHTYDAAQPVAPWLYAIARYKTVDALRRRGVPAGAIAADDLADTLAAPADESADAAYDVAIVLARLPETYRTPLELVKLKGLSIAEAAAQTGRSESAIKVAIHRGMKKLSAAFGRSLEA
jgi:RNA polymerase sigma-70 factor (ECF subfamily)